MSVKIRLSRGGAKKRPYYRIVVADSRSPRDGRFIERVGSYNPMAPKDHPNRVVLKDERVKHWLGEGARRPIESPIPGQRRHDRGSDPAATNQARPAQTKGPGTHGGKGSQSRRSRSRRQARGPVFRILTGPGHGLARSETDPGSVCLGVITGARGVRGEVKIKSFAEDPLASIVTPPCTTGKAIARRSSRKLWSRGWCWRRSRASPTAPTR